MAKGCFCVPGYAYLDLAVCADLFGFDVNVNDLGIGGEASTEVEEDTNEEDDDTEADDDEKDSK